MQELLGHCNPKKILDSLVLGLDYLQRRRNPKLRWNNVPQYLLNAELIQSELGLWISDPASFVARTPREVDADPDDESLDQPPISPAQSEKGLTSVPSDTDSDPKKDRTQP